MKGYFISEENANKLGLIDAPNFIENSQKTIIVLTEDDIKEQDKNVSLEKEKLKNFMDWFYSNYYDTLVDSFLND